MSSDSDDDMPLARSNGHSEFKFASLNGCSPREGRDTCLPTCHLHHDRHGACSACQLKIPFHRVPDNTLLLLVSASTIPKSVDKAMDKTSQKHKRLPAGVSIRHGPVTENATTVESATNGNAKRKSRPSVSKTLREDSASDDDVPIVRLFPYCANNMLLGRPLTAF
jgi:hypothetical protein